MLGFDQEYFTLLLNKEVNFDSVCIPEVENIFSCCESFCQNTLKILISTVPGCRLKIKINQEKNYILHLDYSKTKKSLKRWHKIRKYSKEGI